MKLEKKLQSDFVNYSTMVFLPFCVYHLLLNVLLSSKARRCRAKDLEGISIFVIYLCILPEVDIENIFLNS